MAARVSTGHADQVCGAGDAVSVRSREGPPIAISVRAGGTLRSVGGMEQHVLGTSGLTVSSLALGTMTFGVETDEAGAVAQLDRFVEAGGTMIDTADVYGAGRSEEIIGRWLADRGHHDDLVIATKGRFPMGDGPLDRGAGRRHLQRAVQASLRRLGVDVIDLYQVHGWDQSVPLEETLQTLDDLVRAGTVRYVGIATGMNSLIRPALYGAYHEIVNLTRFGQAPTDVVTIVGPICETGDRLGSDRLMPATREGDVLLIANVGAYGHAMSSRYNLREPAEEIMLLPPAD